MLITLDIADEKYAEFMGVVKQFNVTIVYEPDEDDYEVDFDDPNMPEWHKVELRKRIAEHDPSTDMTLEELKIRMDAFFAEHAIKV